MTVQDTPNFISYVGNDVQTVFNFVFRVDDVAWLSVDFTDNFDQFNLNLNQDLNPGGNATYTVAPPSPGMGGPDAFTITRATPQTQEQDYTRYDPFDSESTEDNLDKIVMMIQDLADTLANLLYAGTVEGSILRWDTSLAIDGWNEFGPGVNEFLLPAQDGAAGQVMVTDGAGQLSWTSITPGAVFAGTTVNSTLRWTGANWAEFLTYLFPAVDGNPGEALVTDGAGQLSFAPAGGAVGTVTNSVLRYDGAAYIENVNVRIAASGAMTLDQSLSWSDGVDVMSATEVASNLVWAATGGFGYMDMELIQVRLQQFFVAEELLPPTFTPAGYGLFWVDGRSAPNRPAFRDDGSQLYQLQTVQPPLFVNSNQDLNTGNTAFGMIGNAIYYDDGANYAITLEDNGSDDFVSKSSFDVLNPGSGDITVTQGTGTQLFLMDGPGGAVTGPANVVIGVGGVATIFRRSSQVWVIFGTNLT